jgi:hypothetical protein
VSWTKNVSFNEDANPVRVVKEVNVYKLSLDTFPLKESFSDYSELSVGGVECRKGDPIFDTCGSILVL